MRRSILLGLSIISVAAIGGVCWWAKPFDHKLTLKTYLQDAHGLHTGAPVTIAGVDVGKVTSVRIIPELGKEPAEIVMRISTPYELRIPSDSRASVALAGVLGDPYLEIQMEGASGAPAQSGAVLKSSPTVRDDVGEIVNTLIQDLIKKQIAAGGVKINTPATVAAQ